MLQFQDIDKDFNLIQDITEKSNKINDALLAVPQLQRPCNTKRNDYANTLMKSFRFFPPVNFPLQLKEFTDQYSDMIGNSCLPDEFGCPTESCSSDTSDDIEVIPNSCQESEVCFDLGYNLDSPLSAKLSSSQCDQILELENFTQERVEEGTILPFEEPLIYDGFKQAASKILASNVLLNRLQMYFVEDPLFQSNGKTWEEKKVFREDHSLENFIQPVIPRSFISENFEPLNAESQKKHTEGFSPPFVTSDASSSCLEVEKIHDLTTAMALLHDDQQGFTLDMNLPCETLLDGDWKVFTLDRLPDFVDTMGDCEYFVDLNNKDSQLQKLRSSPFVSFKNTEMKAGDAVVDEFCMRLKKNLGFLKVELPSSHFLTNQKATIMDQEIVKNELHYDKRRLSEPAFSPYSSEDPVSEAFHRLDLLTVQDNCLNLESYTPLTELSKGLHENLICPLSMVSVLKRNTHKINLFPPEEFSKLEIIKEDSHLCEVTHSSPNIPSEQAGCLKEKQESFHLQGNPLDTFMLCRTKTFQKKINSGKQSSTTLSLGDSKIDLNGTTTDPPSKKCVNLHTTRILRIPFTGPYMEALKYVIDFAMPHFDIVKQYGSIPPNQSFMDTNVDKMKFLYKEIEQKCSKDKSPDEEHLEPEHNYLRTCAILLHVRKITDLLLHACLESATTHLSSCIDLDAKSVGRSLVHLHEKLFQTQIEFIESNCEHPKFVVLRNEVNKSGVNINKILILCQNGLLSLQSALSRMLYNVSSLPVNMVNGIKSLEVSSPKPGITILPEEHDLGQKALEHFSLIMEYDASNPKVQSICETIGISYIGFISEIYEIKSSLASACAITSFMSKPFTVISSAEVTQHKKLVYILEARYNILIVERNYLAQKQDPPFVYADVILDFHHCIVLLALHEMCSQWDLEAFVTRLVALGLQCSFCFVVAHGIGASSRYLLDNNVIRNLYKLRASLSNLSRSSESFRATYKVLICSNEDDIALYIRTLSDKISNQNAGELFATVIKSEMSQEEAFLLQFMCFNSYRAQTFLSQWTLDDILKLEAHEIKKNVPGIADNFLSLFEQLIPKRKDDDCISISSDSQQATSVSINMSSSPAVSTDKGSAPSQLSTMNEDDFLLFISSESSVNSAVKNKTKTTLAEERLQDNIQEFQIPNTKMEDFHEQDYIDEQEQSYMEKMKSLSYSKKSPLISDGITLQSEIETTNAKKRPTTLTETNTQIKRRQKMSKHTMADLPSSFKGNSFDQHSHTEHNKVMQKRKRHFSFTEDPSKYNVIDEESENSVFFIGKSQNSYRGKKQHSEVLKKEGLYSSVNSWIDSATRATSFDKCDYKNTQRVLSPKQEVNPKFSSYDTKYTKHANASSYSISSEKIYCTDKHRNESKTDTCWNLMETNKSGILGSSAICTQDTIFNANARVDHHLRTYTHHHKFTGSRRPTEKKDPFTSINYSTLQDGLANPDFFCESIFSHIGQNPPLLREKNACKSKSNNVQSSTYPSFLEKPLKSQEQKDTISRTFPFDLLMRSEAKQEYFYPQESNEFERYRPKDLAHTTIENVIDFKGNPSSSSTFDSFKYFKNDLKQLKRSIRLRGSEKAVNQHRYEGCLNLYDSPEMNMSRDQLHLPQKSNTKRRRVEIPAKKVKKAVIEEKMRIPKITKQKSISRKISKNHTHGQFQKSVNLRSMNSSLFMYAGIL